MNIKNILAHTDHTLLKQTATEEEIKLICDEAIKWGCASACIPPSFVKMAKEYVGDRLKICTVIGFPNGYNTTAVKCFETEQAVKEGADEIDMVINLGMVKDGLYDQILEEIKAIKDSCNGKLLKVIIETCFLTDVEKMKLCRIVTLSGADYIKTSTGFGGEGASLDDIRLFAECVGENVKIKAAGGISTLNDAEEFLAFGADRLGSSRIIRLVKEELSDD